MTSAPRFFVPIVGLAVMSSGCTATGSLRGSSPNPRYGLEGCALGPGDIPTAIRWTPAQRQAFESRARRGVVVLATDGCRVRVLDACHAPARYAYVAIPIRSDTRDVSSDRAARAQLPWVTGSIGGHASGASRFALAFTIVGSFEAARMDVSADELVGDCAGATHITARYDAGAFALRNEAGFDAQAGSWQGSAPGLGARSASRSEETVRTGYLDACAIAQGNAAPSSACSAVIDVQLAAITPARTPAPATPVGPPAPPSPLAVDTFASMTTAHCTRSCAGGDRSACAALTQRCAAGDIQACLDVANVTARLVLPPGIIAAR